MQTATYQQRRGQLETYFNRTAMEAWARLTSDAPVSRIRATVRAGRDEMRATLLSWLPDDLRGCRLLDAGCGTGSLAVEAARRGAQVVAIDVAPRLIELARERAPRDLGEGSIEFHAGDMLDPALGHFDHVVAMDSLIHYNAADCVGAVTALAGRTRGSVVFTYAPRTPALTVLHGIGRLFPRSERAPAIQPISETTMQRMLAQAPGLGAWRAGRTKRIASGFYKSQAMEICRP